MRKYKRTLKFFGKKLKILRKSKKWTQEDLAEMVSVSSTYIGFLEQGLRAPSLKTADKLARALDVEITDLLTYQ